MDKIINGKVIIGDKIHEGANIYYENGIIQSVTSADIPCDRILDAHGAFVSPGFIEIHCHGGGDADFLDGTKDAFLTASALHARHGVTTLYPTATSGSLEETLQMEAAYIQAITSVHNGADMPGLHLEGPYFSPQQCGAQNPRFLRNPNPEEYLPLLDRCKSIARWSIAPELPGALELGKECVRRGILAAIGHSNAEFEEAIAAWEAGFTHVTHLYSSMSSIHRVHAYRHGGVVEAAYLTDDMTVEIIADGKHLPAELLQLVYKIKGPDRIALVTDAMRGAGMPEGPSILGHKDHGLATIIENGVAMLPDRLSFAGSVATYDRLVRNMVQLAHVPLTEAVKMATATPAKIMGLTDRGIIQPGLCADFAIFDCDICISHVIVHGRMIR